MAHLAEAPPAPLFDVGALWGAFGGSNGVDMTQWRWEAPARRPDCPPSERPRVELPTWLMEYGAADEGAKETEAQQPKQRTNETDFEAEILLFRETLHNTSILESTELICKEFNDRFKRGLVLGQVPDEAILTAIKEIPRNIRKRLKIDLSGAQADSLTMSFYKTVWEGLNSCTVLKPQDFDARIFNRLLKSLERLAWNDDIQDLASEVIKAMPHTQISEGVHGIVKAWSLSWLNESPRDKLSLLPSPSVLALSDALGSIQTDTIELVLPTLTSEVMKAFRLTADHDLKSLWSLKESWAAMVANMPNVSEDLFIAMLRELDRSMGKPLTLKGGIIPRNNLKRFDSRKKTWLAINYWMCNGRFCGSSLVKQEFMTWSVDRVYHHHLAGLLAIMDKHRASSWKQARCLFALFRRLGFAEVVHKTLEYMPKVNMKVPASLVATEMREAASTNVHLALKLYRLYRKIRFDNKPLLLEGVPEVILQMIRSPLFSPHKVWDLLQIPLITPRNRIRRPGQQWRTRLRVQHRSKKPLAPAKVALIQRMATEFSRAPHLRPRVAQRQVTQCIGYLWSHGTPANAEVSRALVHAAVSRPMKMGLWVSTMRIRWLLTYVRAAEGEEVARLVDETIYMWRTEYIRRQQEQKRSMNPLRLRCID
jgi:hypothetical protein